MNYKQQPEIITVTLNPAIDSTLYFHDFQVGQVNRVDREVSDPGGKGVNVAKVIKALGLKAAVTGFLGKENAAFFHNYFRQEHIKDCFIEIGGATRINIKIVDERNGQVSEINYSGLRCEETDLLKMETALQTLAAPGNWFIFSGSLPQNAPSDLYARLLRKLPNGCKTFLDTSGTALAKGISAKPFTVKPNINELSEIMGRQLQADADILAAMDQILNSGVNQVMVSLGADGALVATCEQRWRIKPPQLTAKSTVGAGDAMVAGFVAGQVRGCDLVDSIRLATAAAAASVAKVGTRAGSLVEVKKLCDQVIIEEIG
jgi:1-phosphofructokinase